MDGIDNNKIAMSMLRMCAWLWEHCTKYSQEGEFKLSEVMQGFGRNAYKSRVGTMMVNLSWCKYWNVFNGKTQPIEGLTYDQKAERATLKFGTFCCSFDLRDVFQVTARFCKWNCPSMANKARFCYKGGERWAVLPEIKVTQKPQKARIKAKPKTTKHRATAKQMPAAKPLTLAEQLRQALLARMAA